MKRHLIVFGVMIMMFITLFAILASAEDVHHTVTFHSGTDGLFSDGTDTNVVSYSAVHTVTMNEISHTVNVSDDGEKLRNYPVTSRGYAETHVVTIPDAERLKVTITYASQDSSDWVIGLKGNYPKATGDYYVYSFCFTGKLYGGNHTSANHTKVYYVDGDTVTFAWRSTYHRKISGDLYGYYAVVEADVESVDVVAGVYEEPSVVGDSGRFEAWTTNSDGSGTVYTNMTDVSETMDLYADYVIDSGMYRGVNWRINLDGKLIIGKQDETQVFTNMTNDDTPSWPWKAYKDLISSVEVVGVVHGTGNMREMFADLSQANTINVANLDTSAVTSMAKMFRKCSLIESIDLSNWDTSNVTGGYVGSTQAGMIYMFSQCSNLKSLDLSNFDVSNVSSIEGMFEDCTSLTSLDVSTWDVSHIRRMFNTFSDCSSLTELDLSSWRPVSATMMESLFAGCSELVSLDLSNFTTSSATSMYNMFMGCESLQSLDLSKFDTSHVSDMGGMFDGCRSLTFLDLSSFDTSAVTSYMGYMFNNCEELCKIVLGDHNPFKGRSEAVNPPTPPLLKDGVYYTGKWIREDGVYGPYTSSELWVNYTSIMEGNWIWERELSEYTITFAPMEEYYDWVDFVSVGEMPSVIVDAHSDYQLPPVAYTAFGYDFDHWVDSFNHTFADMSVIPGDTYNPGDDVLLVAYMVPRNTGINMQDGAFDFSIKADEKALFQPIPASTSYQVYEQTPFGWNLIKQVGNAGTILPDEESEALFLNKYDPLKVTIRFAGTKLMNESAAEPGSYNFLLYEDDTLIDIASVSEGGAIEFQPIEYDVAGEHHYYIKEVIGSDHTVEYDTHVEEIIVSITSDGVGHLSADVTMDEDEILFENKSKPGMLALRKLNAATEDRDGVFYYEVQFRSENGQPYDLLSSDISYEEREGNVSDFPEVQPLPEKPKYTLTVQHISMGAGLSETVRKTETYQYCAGDIVAVHAVDTSGWSGTYFYQLDDVSSDAVRAANGTYKLLMPSENITVQAKYNCYSKVGASARWQGVDSARPPLIFNVFANGEYVGSMDYVTTDPSVEYDESKYTYWPTYNSEGQSIVYTVELDEIPADYVLATVFRSPPEFNQFQLIAGYRVHLIWDDYDNRYGLRRSMVDTAIIDDVSNSLYLVELKQPDWSFVIKSKTVDYREHDYNVRPVEPHIPDGYTVIYSSNDDTLDKYEYRMKLTSAVVKGAIIWDDNENATGLRPSSAVVHVMKDGVSIDSQVVAPASGWRYSFTNLPLLENNELVEYEVYVEPVDGYKFTVDGYNVNAKFASATISVAKWSNQINASNNDSLPLRSATTFTRNMTYASVDELPVDAIKIDDDRTSFSIYFWMDGTDAKWWSDAVEVRLPSNSSSLFYGCSRLTSIDLSGLNTSHVVNMSNLFALCSSLTNLNISEFDTSNVTDMSSMFYYCIRLQNLDLSHFDTSHVTSMRCMFYYLYHQRGSGSLNITSFDTSNVRDMWGMFQNCNCSNLDLSSFDTSKVTEMSWMFNYCQASRVYVSDLWTTDLVSSSGSMFGGFSQVVGGAGTVWNRNYPTDKTYARVDNLPDEPGYFTYKVAPTQP